MANRSSAFDGVTFAQPYPDARSDKIARGLAARGISVRRFLIDFDAGWQTTFATGTFEGTYRLPDTLRRHIYLATLSGLGPWALRKILARLPGAILRTSTPDLVGAAAIGSEKRLIAEVYDTWSLYDASSQRSLAGRLRGSVELQAERTVHEQADLLVYTTEEMLEYVEGRYAIKRAIVVPNAVLAADLPKVSLPKLSEDGRLHCVYVGLIAPSVDGASRSIVPYLRELSGEHEVHVYGVAHRLKEAEVRRELMGVAQWHDPVPQPQLIAELTQYDFGLILLPRVDVRRFHTVVPNKIFEYVCAGLPVLVSPYRALENFVRTYHCGSIYGEGIPRGVVAIRPEFVLDTYLVRYADEIRKLGG